MSSPTSGTTIAPEPGLSVHRSEALTDGIYAVAMTLLVIELKLPESTVVHSSGDLAQALIELLPKIIAWTISFFVLAMFWFGHHRAFSHVRRADGRLVLLNLLQLAFVSLMPFSCALIGEHGREMLAQLVYSLNMFAMSLLALLTARHIHACPNAAQMAMTGSAYRGVRVRVGGLMLISAAAVGIGWILPGAGNMAFMLMALVMPFSRRVERVEGAAVSM